jgi:hypothetical protein
MELPARRLWEIVRRRMRIEEVEPTEEATERPAAAGKLRDEATKRQAPPRTEELKQ